MEPPARRSSARLRARALRRAPLPPISLLALPHDVTLAVLSHLPPPALAAAECCCRHFAQRVRFEGAFGAEATHHEVTNDGIVLSLPERAAQLGARPALPVGGESFKELLAWGRPLGTWEVERRHSLLQLSGGGGPTHSGLRSPPETSSSEEEDADDDNAQGQGEAGSGAEGSAAAAAAAAPPPPPAPIASTHSVDTQRLLWGNPEIQEGEGPFPAAVSPPLPTGPNRHARVRIRLTGSNNAVAPCAVGVCPASFAAHRRCCPTSWYDLYEQELRRGLCVLQGTHSSVRLTNPPPSGPALTSGDRTLAAP